MYLSRLPDVIDVSFIKGELRGNVFCSLRRRAAAAVFSGTWKQLVAEPAYKPGLTERDSLSCFPLLPPRRHAGLISSASYGN